MGIIATDKNQIKLYYNSKNSLGKQTLSYVTSSEKKILGIDISKTKVPSSQWAEIAAGIGVTISDLIDTEHPDFIKTYGDKNIDLNENDWLKVLEQHPESLKFPIVILGDEFRFIKSPSEFSKFMEDDSTGQENPFNKNS